ncbi:MAG: dTDP-4-dehydrorhamnose reductase [Rikenellaceae bacterium]|nr:dTDP-4-dehydrorhamnose reductase [Rikenellaceae bacterium]
MNILVTGANGQLGQELRILPNTDAIYFFTDVEELDITNKEDVRHFVDSNQIEVIINCAAYTDVNKAEEESAKAEQINTHAVANLANVAKKSGATLIHISTDYVFGNNSINEPIKEDAATNPMGVYGRTKFDGEEEIIKSGCRYIIIRTAWLYSSYGKNFVKTILRLAQEKDSINVVYDQVGTPTYAGDLALVIKMIAESELRHIQGVYHFSNEGAISWYDFAQAIVELGGVKCNIIPCKTEDFGSTVERPHYSVLDKTKIKQTLGMSIPYWKDSLKECLSKING